MRFLGRLKGSERRTLFGTGWDGNVHQFIREFVEERGQFNDSEASRRSGIC